LIKDYHLESSDSQQRDVRK